MALLGVGVYCLVKKGEVNSKTNEFVDNIEKNNAFVKTIQDKLSKEWEAVKNLKGDYEKRNGKYAQLTI